MPHSSLRQWGVYSLTAETSDTSPSLLLCFDTARYLFNAGEGTTRAFVAKSAGFKKLGTVLTTRADSKTAGGLPGLIMTLSEHHGDQTAVTDIDVIGPPSLSHFLASSRFHTRRNMTDLRVHETLGADGDARSPIYADDCVCIYDFPMTVPASSARLLKRKRDQDADSQSAGPNGKRKRSAAHMLGAEAKDWLRNVIQDMFHGPEYRYTGPRPSPAWDSQRLPELDKFETDQITSYVVIGPAQRGKFLPHKAKAQGVPPGPLYGKLHKGERVQLQDGTWIEPASCVSEDEPRHAFALIDCPHESCISQLAGKAFLDVAAGEGASLKLIFHILGAGVVHSKAYWQWANGLGDVEHVVSSAELCADQVAYGGVTLLQLRLAKLSPSFFPTPRFSARSDLLLAEVQGLPPRTSLWMADKRWPLGTGPGQDFAFTSSSRTLDIELGSKEAEKRLAQLHWSGTSPNDDELRKAGEAAWQDFQRLTTEAQRRIAGEAQARIAQVPKSLDEALVTCLGTGSASPSVYRNVSGTLLEIPNHGAILFDCGENTLGQIKRMGGPKETEELLQKLRLICISHMHSDHHAGLAALLHARATVTGAAPLALLAPRLIWTGLQDHDAVEPLALDSVTFMGTASLLSESVLAPIVALEGLGLSRIKTVEVDHRGGQCFGFVIDGSAPWRIVYSGDTRPSDKLVAAGMNADLLIHESTLDNEHEEQANIKGHSTNGQAIDIARRMKARTLLLTHFSQRYPKLTTISPDMLAQDGCDIALAFDGMQMKLGHAWQARHFLEPMKALLGDLEPVGGSQEMATHS